MLNNFWGNFLEKLKQFLRWRSKMDCLFKKVYFCPCSFPCLCPCCYPCPFCPWSCPCHLPLLRDCPIIQFFPLLFLSLLYLFWPSLLPFFKLLKFPFVFSYYFCKWIEGLFFSWGQKVGCIHTLCTPSPLSVKQASEWIFYALAINRLCKEVFSKIAWVTYCLP